MWCVEHHIRISLMTFWYRFIISVAVMDLSRERFHHLNLENSFKVEEWRGTLVSSPSVKRTMNFLQRFCSCELTLLNASEL